MTELDKDPADLLRDLGLDRGTDAPAPPPELSAVHAAITEDLERKQGPWRAGGALRFLPALLAGVIAVALMVVWPGSRGGPPLVIASAALGGAAALLCLFAAALAPAHPGRAERVSLVGLLAAVAAIGAQVALGLDAPEGSSDTGALLRCGSMIGALSVVPFALLFLMLRRSGVPVRPLHASAIVVSALAMSGAGVWRHCDAAEAWHLVLGHAAMPAVLAVAMAFAIYRMLRPEPLNVSVHLK